MAQREVSANELELWQSYTQGMMKLCSPPTVKPIVQPSKKPSPPSNQSHYLDLHGLTLDQAHSQTLDKIRACAGVIKSLVFVTGKSGQIRQEFAHWVSNHPLVRSVEELNGGGAFRVRYKKSRLNTR